MIAAEDLKKSYSSLEVLDGVSLSVEDSNIYAIVGPSGCGKTTLLKILSGIIEPDRGVLKVNGRTGVVFQEPRLLPWRSLEGNIRLVEDIADVELSGEDVDELLELIDLKESKDSLPKDLSGGMKQRAAFARALAFRPDLVLLDEPFNSLDYYTKESLLNDFKDTIESRDLASIFVTHNLDDALEVSDRVIMMSDKPAEVIDEVRASDHSTEELRKIMNQYRTDKQG